MWIIGGGVGRVHWHAAFSAVWPVGLTLLHSARKLITLGLSWLSSGAGCQSPLLPVISGTCIRVLVTQFVVLTPAGFHLRGLWVAATEQHQTSWPDVRWSLRPKPISPGNLFKHYMCIILHSLERAAVTLSTFHISFLDKALKDTLDQVLLSGYFDRFPSHQNGCEEEEDEEPPSTAAVALAESSEAEEQAVDPGSDGPLTHIARTSILELSCEEESLTLLKRLFYRNWNH